MFETGLSLIGLRELNLKFLISIQEMGVLSVDLVPSHFIEINSVDFRINPDKLKIVSESGIRAVSIQGLLFGFQPGGFSRIDICQRIELLTEVASKLNVDRFVLGAPNFRKIHGDWAIILETFASKLEESDIELCVENICTTPCDGTPFGTIPLSQYGFQKVFDVANAFDCNSKCFMRWDEKHSFVYSHLADLDHSVPKSKDSYEYIKSLASCFGITEESSWEFNLGSEKDFMEALGILRKFDAENLGA
jgi:hypothetical protein